MINEEVFVTKLLLYPVGNVIEEGNTLDAEPSVFKPHPVNCVMLLGKALNSYSVPLHLVYEIKWVPERSSERTNKILGGQPATDLHPIQAE